MSRPIFELAFSQRVDMVVYEAAIVAWCRDKSVGESGLCSDFIESLGESENDSKGTWQLLQGQDPRISA